MSGDRASAMTRRELLRGAGRCVGSALVLGLAFWLGLRRRTAGRRAAREGCGFDCDGCAQAWRCGASSGRDARGIAGEQRG